MNWEQFKAVLWLRSRLWANRWRRSSSASRALSVVFTVLLGVALSGVFAGGVLAGWFGLADASPLAHLITWDIGIGAFLLFWFIGLMVELQRSESIDTSKLMHLPVSLPQLLILNFVASLFVPSILILAAATTGLTLGLLRGGIQWILLGLPAAALVFAVAAWTYSLRNWLAVLMTNARRKRSILVALTVTMMLAGQLPNFLMNTPWARRQMRHEAAALGGGGAAAKMERIRAVHRFIPPAWPAYAASSLAEGEMAPALAATACFGLLGSAGLWGSYRQAMRLYGQSESGRRRKIRPAIGSSPAVSPARAKAVFNDRDIPWLPPEAGTLALTFLRSNLRAPELRIMLASPLIMVIAFASIFARHQTSWTQQGPLAMAGTGAVFLSLIALTPLFTNQFGFDRHGFRGLMLLPTPRRLILLGKNAAILPLAGPIGLLFAAAGSLISHRGIMGFATAAALWLAGFLIMCVLGNWASVCLPSRISPGGAIRGGQSAGRVLQHLLLLLAQMAALSPLMLPAGVYYLAGQSAMGSVFSTITAAALLAGVAAIYWATLPALGGFLEKRECQVLNEITREIE